MLADRAYEKSKLQPHSAKDFRLSDGGSSGSNTVLRSSSNVPCALQMTEDGATDHVLGHLRNTPWKVSLLYWREGRVMQAQTKAERHELHEQQYHVQS